MEGLLGLLRLGVRGLLLDPVAYRAQRDEPEAVQRGVLLIALIGLLVGLASWIGSVGVYLTSPNPVLVVETLVEGLDRLPLFQDLLAESPDLQGALDEALAQQSGGLASTPLGGITNIISTPLVFLLRWFLFGAIVHLAARAFGGMATFGQTLACTALASGASLLELVTIIPYAQVAATTILGLIATYVGVREAHGLAPGRAVAAVALGPLLGLFLLTSLFCCVLFLVVSALGNV
ncbi:MAG: YIP1 family protein [Oscillochloridaceae bacterium umkhey_bin13]